MLGLIGKKGQQESAQRAFDTTTNMTSVFIPKYRVKENYVEYVIECTRLSYTWQVFRRYQQFKALHGQLTSLCPSGTPYHCEYGVVPVLCGTSWTEVTNQSPELVERRRRYLEIYLQQLLVGRNLFYIAKTPLHPFLHEGEVPMHYRVRHNRPIGGLTIEETLADPDEEDEQYVNQVVAAQTTELQNPENAVAASTPDFSSTNASKTVGARAELSTKAAPPMSPVAMKLECEEETDSKPRERCPKCGLTSVIDYKLEEWQSFGRCQRCNAHTPHELLLPKVELPKIDPEDAGEAGDVALLPHASSHIVDDSQERIDTPTVPHERIDPPAQNPGGMKGQEDLNPHVSATPEIQTNVASPFPMPDTREPLFSANVSPNDFQMITTLGRGTFGKVIKVRHLPTGRIYAMKVLNKSVIYKRKMIDYIKEEKNILAMLPPHPYIVSLHFAFQTEQHVYFVLDYLPGGELYAHIYPQKTLRESDARLYLAELVLALEHMHNYDVVHRDIKPENIVLDCDGHVKLTDFGLARLDFSRARRRSFVGSAEYLAPETIQGDIQTKALDWWSLGIMMFEMLSGIAPFHAATNNEVYQAVLHKKPDAAKPCFSEAAQNLLSQLLEKDQKLRLCDPTKAKKHPFFAGIDWAALLRREVKPPFIPDLTVNDTKYFHRDFTSEWATVPQVQGDGRQTMELLIRRFSNFEMIHQATAPASIPSVVPIGPTFETPMLISPESFGGIWRLLKVEMVAPDGKVAYPWGSEVAGLLVYCHNGLFSMQLCPYRRHRFKNPAPEKVTKEEMVDAYLSYVALFGQYEVIPGKNFIIHRPTGALCPNQGNTAIRRYFEIRDNRLVLSTGAIQGDDGIAGRMVFSWERVARFDNL